MAYYRTGQGNTGNRIDLYFESDPGEDIRDELKQTGWRWYGRECCWYSYDDYSHRCQAQQFCDEVNYEPDDDDDYDDYDYGYGSNTTTSYGSTNHFLKHISEDTELDASEWNEESILHRHGYNVSQNDGLNDSKRQEILTSLISRRIISSREVCAFLQRMINTRKTNHNMRIAVSKWTRDLEYIQRRYHL